MECKHERLKCTNNIFYCLDCGAVVPDPAVDEPKPEPEKKTTRKKAEK